MFNWSFFVTRSISLFRACSSPSQITKNHRFSVYPYNYVQGYFFEKGRAMLRMIKSSTCVRTRLVLGLYAIPNIDTELGVWHHRAEICWVTSYTWFIWYWHGLFDTGREPVYSAAQVYKPLSFFFTVKPLRISCVRSLISKYCSEWYRTNLSYPS